MDWSARAGGRSASVASLLKSHDSLPLARRHFPHRLRPPGYPLNAFWESESESLWDDGKKKKLTERSSQQQQSSVCIRSAQRSRDQNLETGIWSINLRIPALSFSPKWQGHPSEFFVVLMLVVLIISLIATNIFCLIILLILFFGLFKNIYYSLFTQHSAAWCAFSHFVLFHILCFFALY